MIVRIMGEGQFRLEAHELDHLNEMDNLVVEAVAKDDDAGFKSLFGQLLDYVRAQGDEVPDAELATSDVILPASNLSLAEARSLFAGEGLVPG